MAKQLGAYQFKGWFEFEFPTYEEWCGDHVFDEDTDGYDEYQDAWTEAAHDYVEANVNVYADAYYLNLEER